MLGVAKLGRLSGGSEPEATSSLKRQGLGRGWGEKPLEALGSVSYLESSIVLSRTLPPPSTQKGVSTLAM